jgi:hypothetical protein
MSATGAPPEVAARLFEARIPRSADHMTACGWILALICPEPCTG